MRANGHGLIRTVNDRTDKLDGSTKVLALWNQDTVTSPPGNFVSIVEDETLEVAFHYLGKETMTIEGRQLDVDHYQMVGDEERDIWYDADGQVARVQIHAAGLADRVPAQPVPLGCRSRSPSARSSPGPPLAARRRRSGQRRRRCGLGQRGPA